MTAWEKIEFVDSIYEATKAGELTIVEFKQKLDVIIKEEKKELFNSVVNAVNAFRDQIQ